MSYTDTKVKNYGLSHAQMHLHLWKLACRQTHQINITYLENKGELVGAWNSHDTFILSLTLFF